MGANSDDRKRSVVSVIYAFSILSPISALLYNLVENWVVLLYQQKLYGVGPYFAKIVQIYTISKFLYVWVPDLSHILVF